MQSITASLSPGGIILLCITIWAIWYTQSSVRAWHRLRHIPGPSILATFSYLWLAKTTYSGKQFWIHRELHKKYGPLVRIGPNEVITDDPAIIRKMSSTSSTYHKGTWYLAGRFNPYHDNLFTILEPEAHKKAKARSLAAYNGRETPGLEHGIDEQIATMMKVLRERYVASSPEKHQPLLDLGLITCYFTMDVITRLAFGHEVGYLEDEKDHFDFIASVRDLWAQLATSADVPWIREFLFSAPVLKLLGPKTTDKKGFGALMAVAERHVNKRFEGDASGRTQKDMLASLINRGFSKEECQSEGLLLLLAGTESTACAIRSTLGHIVTSPLVYPKLKEEIHLAVHEGTASRPISFEQARKLPYLQAVIYEGIRMRPPLLGMFPKVVPPTGDNFLGVHIPAGTNMCTNNSALLASSELFGADADVFRPERFLEIDEESRNRMERNVELAFGYGQWCCVYQRDKVAAKSDVNCRLLRDYI